MTTSQLNRIRAQFSRLTTLFNESTKLSVKTPRRIRETREHHDAQQDVLTVGYDIIDSLPRDDRQEYVWDGEENDDGSVTMYAYARLADSAAMKLLVKKAVAKIKTMPGVTSVKVSSERFEDEELINFTFDVQFDGVTESTRCNRIPSKKRRV